MKWCNKGQHFVVKTGFSNLTRAADGLQSVCKECRQRYSQENAVRINARRQKYRDANKEKIREQNARCYAKCDKSVRRLMNVKWREENAEQYIALQRRYYLQNKEIIQERASQHYAANKAQILQKQKVKYEQNREYRERVLQRQNEYRLKHQDRIRLQKQIYWARIFNDPNRRFIHNQKSRAYYQSRPEMRRYHTAKYRGIKSQANGSFTPDQWTAKLLYYGYRCYLCSAHLHKSNVHLDHRIPLSRGGSNWIANLAPACQTCNLRKSNKTELEYRLLMHTLSVS